MSNCSKRVHSEKSTNDIFYNLNPECVKIKFIQSEHVKRGRNLSFAKTICVWFGKILSSLNYQHCCLEIDLGKGR